MSIPKFAEEDLEPSCSPKNIELCDDDKKMWLKNKIVIGKYSEVPVGDLEANYNWRKEV